MTAPVAEGLADVLTGGPTADQTESRRPRTRSPSSSADDHAPAAPAADARAHGTHARHRQAAQELRSCQPIRRRSRICVSCWNELHGAGDLRQAAGLRGGHAGPDRRGARRRRATLPEKLLPLNRIGDEEGCHLENGVVRTPKGFKEAYQAFVEGGWTALAADPEYRRPGPARAREHRGRGDDLLGQPVLRHVSGLEPGRLQRRCACMAREELKQRYLPKLVDGSWSGTMCLTEPQCGTDLGLMRTKAEPAARRQLSHHRHQDLHLRRRARSDREHRPSGAGAPARRAGGHARHHPVPRAQDAWPTGQAQRRSPAARSNKRWASRRRPPAS